MNSSTWHAGFWPPLFASYWAAVCLLRGKLKLIPYHLVDGLVETAGMVRGGWDILTGAMKGGVE